MTGRRSAEGRIAGRAVVKKMRGVSVTPPERRIDVPAWLERAYGHPRYPEGPAMAAAPERVLRQWPDADAYVRLCPVDEHRDACLLLRAPISPQHEIDLRADTQFREIARYLAGTPGNILVAGHVADYGGFHIIVSNNIPTDPVGAADAVTGYQGLAFGPGGVGWAIGMDAEARRSKDDDFGREDRVVWIAHEAFGLLDADFVERIVTS